MAFLCIIRVSNELRNTFEETRMMPIRIEPAPKSRGIDSIRFDSTLGRDRSTAIERRNNATDSLRVLSYSMVAVIGKQASFIRNAAQDVVVELLGKR
jgi:hypothetical protein